MLTFPVTSSIVRFAAGLEILLQKAQDWETVASKHTSLNDNLKDITQLIIEWKRLELG